MFQRTFVLSALAAVAACSDDASVMGAVDAGWDAWEPDSADSAVPDEPPPQPDATILLPPVDAALEAPCNGAVALCDRPYDQVVHLTTHHSVASGSGWPLPSQQLSISEQLVSAGVRGLSLELHLLEGAPALCADGCTTHSASALPTLDTVASFLRDNRREVLTLLVESHVSMRTLSELFAAAGLTSWLHAQPLGSDWPALGAMIAADRRLVVFVDERLPEAAGMDGGADAGLDAYDASADGGDAAADLPWLHRWQDWFWETTEYATGSPPVDCSPERGSAQSPLIQLNHLLPVGVSSEQLLPSFHAAEVVATRLVRCRDDRGRLPVLLVVDFIGVGDPNGGVQIASGLR